MKKILKKKRSLVLAAVAIFALVLCWYLAGNSSGQMKTAGHSPYQGAPLEQYAAQTEQEQYGRGVTEVKISIRNDGETAHEFNLPILEGQQNGIWYSLKKDAENTVADLLYIEPGETKTYSLWMKSYGKLAPGRYRAVFQTWENTNYITAEFNIAE